MECNINKQKELETVCNLITNAPVGAIWRVLCYEPPTSQKNKLETVHNIITNTPVGEIWRVLCYEPPTPKKQKTWKSF